MTLFTRINFTNFEFTPYLYNFIYFLSRPCISSLQPRRFYLNLLGSYNKTVSYVFTTRCICLRQNFFFVGFCIYFSSFLFFLSLFRFTFYISFTLMMLSTIRMLTSIAFLQVIVHSTKKV